MGGMGTLGWLAYNWYLRILVIVYLLLLGFDFDSGHGDKAILTSLVESDVIL